MNTLYYGDNLHVMQEKMQSESIDLIYLDPPFNSDRNYTTKEGKEAFCDTWSMDALKEDKIDKMPQFMAEHGINPDFAGLWEGFARALRNIDSKLLGYLVYMTERLIVMKGLLKPTGSIYLHCDPAASHYLKIIMDGIFGRKNFLNEIVWKRTNAHSGNKKWGPIHDIILYYKKENIYYWSTVYTKYDDEYIKDFYKLKNDRGVYQEVTLTGPTKNRSPSTLPWRGFNTSQGRGWAPPLKILQSEYPNLDLSKLTTHEKLDLLYKCGRVVLKDKSQPRYLRYLTDNPGVEIQDVIIDIKPLGTFSKEKLGYPTQKPAALLDRIIKASCPPGGVVFDPFCGCGTTIYAAIQNNCQWIGCDVGISAINIIKRHLKKKYHKVANVDFTMDFSISPEPIANI